MLRFIALDGIRLIDSEGAPIDDVLARPVSLALLACLTFGRPIGPQRRDRLAVLLWPEKPHEQARHALCQAIYGLRLRLGSEVITSRGSEELAVNGNALRSDVREFWQAVEEKDRARAVRLYHSPLMQFFHLRHAAEFDHWLDSERRTVADAAFRAALGLVDGALTRRDVQGALEWALAARRIHAFSEAATRWVMALLALQGRRVEAIETYRDFRARLMQELELEPGPTTEALAARIRTGSLGPAELDRVRGSGDDASVLSSLRALY